ncbi:protein Nazo [Anabrus simplex]|uniref:protein Nazo n=1 Tax=Anabrus simplex TaxID=316456 RepID=UPI0034DD2443
MAYRHRDSDILEVLVILSEDQHLRVTVTEALKGGLIAFSSALLGGLLGGPRGLAIGGAIGSVIAGGMAQGKFKSVGEVIMNDMTDAQRRRLVTAVRGALGNAVMGTIVGGLLPAVQGNGEAVATIVQTMTTFFRDEMDLNLVTQP